MSRVTLAPKLEVVTVYSDRAQLTFSAPVLLTPSASIVMVVENVEHWGDVDWSTVQVRLGANTDLGVAASVLLQNISPIRETVSEDVRADVQRQKDVTKRIEEERSVCEEEISVLEESLEYLNQIQSFVISAVRGDCALSPESVGHLQDYLQNPSKWNAMGSFLSARRATAQRGLIDMRKKLKDIEERLAKAHRRLEDLGGDSGFRLHARSSLEATLVVGAGVADGAELLIELSCIVMGAGWSPLYDLRLNYGESMLEVLYSANVHQCTSLDWKNVRLRLSTATPHIGGSPPSLWPRWRIATRPPASTLCRGARSRMNMMACALRMPANEAVGYGAAPFAPMVEQALVQGGGSCSNATLYTIPGLVTVRHDNVDVKVTIARESFPARLRFLCMPKVNPLVYLSATAVNATDYEFIAGPSKVFYGNTFVNQSEVVHVSPGEEFEVALGPDETVKVSRTLVRRTESNKTTLFSRSTSRLTFHYAYAVECGALPSDAAVTVVVKDNYPVSCDSDVDVMLMQPASTGVNGCFDPLNRMTVTVDEDTHEVAWELSMTKHDARNFDMMFVATHPKERPVFGLS